MRAYRLAWEAVPLSDQGDGDRLFVQSMAEPKWNKIMVNVLSFCTIVYFGALNTNMLSAGENPGSH